MGYRHLSLLCKCGQPPSRIDEVGLSDDHELVIHWWCEECRRVVYASKPLTECWEDCPEGESVAEERRPAAHASHGNYDDDFLKSLGIRALEEA
jgi:hypothetical protein